MASLQARPLNAQASRGGEGSAGKYAPRDAGAGRKQAIGHRVGFVSAPRQQAWGAR